MLKLALPLALGLVATALPAQEAPVEDGSAAGGMEGMDHSAHGGAAGGEAAGAMAGYMAAMDTMMQSMEGMESAGSPDADFLLMMIPHHQSALDMARVQLEQGQDEATRALAQRVIESQEAEIAEMEALLAAMGHLTE